MDMTDRTLSGPRGLPSRTRRHADARAAEAADAPASCYKNTVHMSADESKPSGAPWSATLDAIPVALIAWREDGTITAANDAAAALLGYPREELLARSYWALTLPGQRPREVAAARRREAPYDKEFIRADGELVTVRVVGVGAVPGGRGQGHLCAFTAEGGGAPR